MKKAIFLIIFIPLNLHTQNLILNPEFKSITCPQFIGLFNSHALSWSAPTFGSTDLFNVCNTGDTGIPDNFNGSQNPLETHNYVGCYFYSKNNYREYIQGEFSSPLRKDGSYKISMYVSLAENSNIAIKNIEFLITRNKIKIATHSELSRNQLAKLKIKNPIIYSLESGGFYDDTEKWTLISKEIVANGNERYITIGNFKNNQLTEKKEILSVRDREMAYYYISNVLVENYEKPEIEIENEKIVTETELIEEKKNEPIEVNKNYIFKNIRFEFNSIELSGAALSELNQLSEVLKTNLSSSISIIGHTDNFGSKGFNQVLSESRANRVRDYLIKRGINAKRINATGLGDLKPIAPNSTVEGRDQNRRVEFKIEQKNLRKG